jgi:putative (di)nucleoside polyphosphate hydrolase
VDEGEALEAAARRELTEETGARSITYLGRTDGWIAYDFPENHGGPKAFRGWRGQKQVWFAFRFDGEEAEFDLQAHGEPEFDDWRWGYLEDAVELIVPFKRAAYETLARAFAGFAAPRGHGASAA